MNFSIGKPYTNSFSILPALVVWDYFTVYIITLGWGYWSVNLHIDRNQK
jgi:hypothetical protein